MIYIGTDIVKISRIGDKISENGKRFLSHIFTDKEQSFCNGKISPLNHYGGKFAAKEAVKKALLSSNKKKSIALKNHLRFYRSLKRNMTIRPGRRRRGKLV